MGISVVKLRIVEAKLNTQRLKEVRPEKGQVSDAASATVEEHDNADQMGLGYLGKGIGVPGNGVRVPKKRGRSTWVSGVGVPG